MRNDKRKHSVKRPNARSLKIKPKTRINADRQKKVPESRFSGNWLQNLGFMIDARATITTMPGLLIVRTDE